VRLGALPGVPPPGPQPRFLEFRCTLQYLSSDFFSPSVERISLLANKFHSTPLKDFSAYATHIASSRLSPDSVLTKP